MTLLLTLKISQKQLFQKEFKYLKSVVQAHNHGPIKSLVIKHVIFVNMALIGLIRLIT